MGVRSISLKAMYSRLYDSMVSWYRQWYSRELYLHAVCVMALTLFMFLNGLTIVNVVAILGFPFSLDFFSNGIRPTLSLFGSLACLNLCFSVWKAGSRNQRYAGSATSKYVAIYYMGASTVFILLSFIGLVAVRPRIQ